MRLQIMANDEMVKKIDFYAEKMSVSRSALCCMLIGQGLMNYDKSFSLIDKIGIDLSEKMKEEIIKE